MKGVLFGFVALCGLLAAAGLWYAGRTIRQAPASQPHRAPSPPRAVSQTTAPVQPTPPASGPALADAPPPTAVLPPPAIAPAAAATPPATQPVATRPAPPHGVVHWVDGAPRRRAERRFARLRDVLATDPHNQAALREALRIAREQDWPNEACDLLGRLVRINPDDPALRTALATELMRLERWIEALPHLEWLTRTRPRDARAWYDLAVAHQAAGHLAAARRAWDRVIELDPTADACARRGEVLLDLRRWADAAADFERALRLDGDSIDAALNLALARSRLGQYEQARAALLPLAERHPRNVPLLNRLARIAWQRYQADPRAGSALAAEALRWARRSLAVVADQPEMRALLAQAQAAAEK